MWHVSSLSGVATLRTAIHLLLTYFKDKFPSCHPANIDDNDDPLNLPVVDTPPDYDSVCLL